MTLQKKQESLLLQKEEKEREERCLASALQAKEVRKQEEKWQLAVRNKEEAEKKEEITKKELEMLGKREEEMRTFYSHTEQLALAYTKEDRKKELQKKQQEISAELEKQKEMLSDLQKKYLAAEEEEDKNKAAYEKADKEYRHGIAGILALDLKEGSPCPVCGALSHPEKAVLSEHMPSEQEVEELKQLYEEKREVRVKLHGNTAACKEKTDALFTQEKELLEEITFFLENENKRDAFVKEYMKEHDEKAFLEQKKEYEALVIMIREKEKLCKERHKEAECCLKKEAEEMRLFEEERGKFFVGNEAYMQAFLPEKELQTLTDSIADYREEMKNTALMITHYEKELSGRVLIDLETYREKLREKKEEKSSLQEVLEKKRHTFIDTDKVMNSLKEKQKKQEKLSAEYGMIKRLDDTASGNNRLRLVFEQYVLAAYFEEILKAANLRLKVMSTGRYELKRMETVGDGRSKDNLEMEVLDYYTGKYRSVKTLSGGESFKVSLALALGMSDVVQALSGGIRVEALFIDEGFGSLDSESLEQACLTLQSLVEKDRLIGIISHVPELAEKIRNRIRIEKTNAGSRIEVMIS